MIRLLAIFAYTTTIIAMPFEGGENLLQRADLDATFAKLTEADFPHIPEFRNFVVKHDKSYNSFTEFHFRYLNFIDNLEKIEKYNKESNGLATFTVNQFADWSWEEFKSKKLMKFGGFSPEYRPNNGGSKAIQSDSYPESFDWRDQGIITPIKDQGHCGSCWAFATVAVLEAMQAKEGNGMHSYSEQQLVDCVDFGCNGGYLDHSFRYIRDNGAPFERDYMYSQKQGKCHNATIRAKFSNMEDLPHSEEQMVGSCVDQGPFAISFSVGPSFMFYSSGIITSQDCKTQPMGYHAIAIVGYGVENGQKYWIGKNSWGGSWGEKGFFRAARDIGWCGILAGPVAGW